MIAIRTLGAVALTVDGAPAPPELLWRKHVALLVYLARSPHRTRSRDHLVALLWGDRTATAARHSLREALRLLRQVAGEGAIAAEGQQLRLTEGAVALDTDRLTELADAGDWEGAAALAQGVFLDGFGVPDASEFEDWLAAERQLWKRRCVDALVRCAAARTRAAAVDAAAEAAHRALALDPGSDEAARAALAAVALDGNRAAALSLYDEFAARLAATFGAEPDAATKALAERIRSSRGVAAPARAGPPRGAESRRAPFVGRQEELRGLLTQWETCRATSRATALAVLGDAGTGRTRLLDELAARARLDGATVVASRAVPADRATEWSGILTLAGGLELAAGVAAAAPGAIAAFAARLTGWQERFRGAAGAAPLEPGPAFSEVLRAAAGEAPVVVVVDDAHWLDGASLRALEAALRDLAALPLLVVLSAFPHAAPDELAGLLARVGRDIPGATIRLAPLAVDQLRTLGRWALPSYGDADLDRLTRRVAADSAGLPLLAVELLHAVALGLDLSGAAGAWPAQHRTLDHTLPGDLPDTVVAAIRVGFRRLGKDAQTALIALSLLEDPATAVRIGRAAGLEGERLTAALDELEWERWVAAGPRGYGFVARLAAQIVARDLVTAGQKQRMLASVGG